MSRLLTAIASVVPALLVAQLPDTTPVPRDLYAAFQTRYVGYGIGQPSFIIGKLPTPEMDRLVPAGATVLGGVVVRRPNGNIQIASAALLMTEPAREAQSRTIEHLKARGFSQAMRPGEPEEGFTSTMTSFGPFHYYCSDSTQVNVTSQDRSEGGSYLVFQVDRVRGEGSMCSTRNRTVSMGRMQTPRQLAFPVLAPPEGAVGRATGGSGWSSDAKTRSVTAVVESELSPEGIVEHYTREFVKHGWKPVKRFKQDNTVVQLLRHQLEGNTREVVLTNVQLPDRTHNVTAQIYALETRITP